MKDNKQPLTKLRQGAISGEHKSSSQPPLPEGTCFRCGKSNHTSQDCRFKDSTCNFCKKRGHLANVCLSKKRGQIPVKYIPADLPVEYVKSVPGQDPVMVTLQLNGKKCEFEVDSGARDNFCSKKVWNKLGRPRLQQPIARYVSATGNPLPVMGTFQATTSPLSSPSQVSHMTFNVTTLNNLNLVGRQGISALDLDIRNLMKEPVQDNETEVRTISETQDPQLHLQKACRKLCEEFPDLFKPELGCLKDFELEVKFKTDAKPVFRKPRTVPYSMIEDLNQAYDAGIKKGIWIPTQFCDYGTPVVPVRKALQPGQHKAKLRVCGDYSGTVNPQLETHRHPMPCPDDLIRRLGGRYYFTKIDLSDAYSQIKLAPESQKRLALSTHKGVLLQTRLPFGISSAPGYFQEIMEKITSDLKGVATYIDDILVSGTSEEDHLQNLRALLQRLQDKGLRCNQEKSKFAQQSVEYLGYTISKDGISKGHKVDAITKLPAPSNVSTLRSFLGSVQFYSKFIKDLATIMEPLTRLTRKDTPWRWGAEEQTTFQRLKDILCSETVLAHFDPKEHIGISCDASEVGLGVVLFHRYSDGTERPIANASKTLTDTQRRYSQVQKEALAVIYGIQKFHQFLYGRKFILVTDHKPLVALFNPEKGTPVLAANRLARWALTLSQYDYTIEYRRTSAHGNADALSRLPMGEDPYFDREEEAADASTVCMVKLISQQLKPTDPGLLAKESSKDPVISAVMRYVKEGWPHNITSEDIRQYKKLTDSLSTENGCLFHGARIVIPSKLRSKVLELVHLGHFGVQRMKQLARSVVYWPHIDSDIERRCRTCSSCAEHQNKPSKPANHPWMLPEKPWSRVHVDHAINFKGTNWLVMIDAYSKYPCIHATTSTSTKATTSLLEEDFAHFGYPHTIVTDNASTFLSEEFQAWCKERGITHLTGAPYHPATNGAAERLVQTFKQSLKKSSLPPQAALQEFLLQYRRTPRDSGYSPSEMLNGRQIRSKLDALFPSPAHTAQGKQAKEATKSQLREHSQLVTQLTYHYTVGAPCYALYYGPRCNLRPRWVPAVVTKVLGTRSVNVRVYPRGPTWRRHLTQLRPRYGVEEDTDPGEVPQSAEGQPSRVSHPQTESTRETAPNRHRYNPRRPTATDEGYCRDHPRRSQRLKLKQDKGQDASSSSQLMGR